MTGKEGKKATWCYVCVDTTGRKIASFLLLRPPHPITQTQHTTTLVHSSMVNDQKDNEEDPAVVLDALRERGNTSYKQGTWFH